MYAVRQFENPRNVLAHQHTTGPQLIEQVVRRLDAFVAGVGTGGTLMGVALALRDHGHATVIVEALPTASLTPAGDREVVGGIPGIVEGMSRLLDPEAVGLDEPVRVPEAEAMTTAREFARRGLAIGPSSGLNIAAARRLAERLGPGHHVGTILPDRMERYFSTALFDDVAPSCAAWRQSQSRSERAELSLRQDLDEVLDPEHLPEDRARGTWSGRSGTASGGRPSPGSCGRRSRRRRCTCSPERRSGRLTGATSSSRACAPGLVDGEGRGRPRRSGSSRRRRRPRGRCGAGRWRCPPRR